MKCKLYLERLRRLIRKRKKNKEEVKGNLEGSKENLSLTKLLKKKKNKKFKLLLFKLMIFK